MIIGGEFSIDINLVNKDEIDSVVIDNRNQKVYTSGRTALYAILQYLSKCGYNKIFIPDYLCSSIITPIKAIGLDYNFYHIRMDFMPDIIPLERLDLRNSSILLINYFGMLDLKDTIGFIKGWNPSIKIIVDDVQNYYGMNSNGEVDFVFTSYRKWFPVPDGAVVCASEEDIQYLCDFTEKNTFVQYKFAGNLLKNYHDIVSDKVCLELLNVGEEMLDNFYQCRHSIVSTNILKHLDFNSIAHKRHENAAFLHKGLVNLEINHLYNEDAVPLFVPINVPRNKRGRLRAAMFERNIFCPIHWPYKNEKVNGVNVLYDTELSLICDQRYGQEEMNRILEILKDEC